MEEPTQSIRVVGIHRSQPGEWLAQVTDNGAMQEVTIQSPSSPEEEENLRWYLEDYALNDPFLSEKAETASSALAHYRRRLLAQLRLGQQVMGLALPIRLDIEECDQAAGFHGIHWEVLEQPEVRHSEDERCSPDIFVRRVVDGALPLRSPDAPSDCFRILLVVSRHLDPSEAGHRMISKKIFDIRERCAHGRLEVEIVRPGTFEAFEAHLKRRGPRYFHAVHFDVHGSVSQSSKAFLHFLSDKMADSGRPQIRGVSATKIGRCLRTYGILIAVLNACESAKSGLSVDGNLAQTLVKAGVPTVLAMSYKALVSAVEDFFEVFYSHLLLQDCTFEAAVYYARRHIARKKLRNARFGIRVPVDDWISPVIYQLKHYNPSIALRHIASSLDSSPIPGSESPDPVVGRDLDIFQLEWQSLHSNVLEIYGDSGAGKTVFLQHLSEWWKQTDYVRSSVFLHGGVGLNSNLHSICREILGVVARISQEVSLSSSTGEPEDLVEETVRFLRQHRCLVILDDFSLTATSDYRVNDIRKFLNRLEGGQSFVILTSTVPRTRATRYRLEGLPRSVAIELSMTVYNTGANNKIDEAELRYLDWLLEMMQFLPACIKVVLSTLQNFSNSPRLLYEALLKGSSALNESISSTVRSQAYLTTSAIYHDFQPSLRNIMLLFSPFWGYVQVDELDGYLSLISQGWDLIFPQRSEIPESFGMGEPRSAVHANDVPDHGYHSLLHAVGVVIESLAASGLWTLVSSEGPQMYRINPLFTLCIRKISGEQGRSFMYEKLLLTFAIWHQCRDLCLWTEEFFSTTESTILVPPIRPQETVGQGLGIIKLVKWTEQWVHERINVLTSFYVGLAVESDEAFPEIFPAARFYHVGLGVDYSLYTDHVDKYTGPQVSKLDISPPSPYQIMELAEQAVRRVRRILEAGKPLNEIFFIHLLDTGLWNAKFHFQYSSPSVTKTALDNFVFVFHHTSRIPSGFRPYLQKLKRDYTGLLGACFLTLLDDYTQDKDTYCVLDANFLDDVRNICLTDVDREEDGEGRWRQIEYFKYLYVSLRESGRYGAIVKDHESQHGSMDIEENSVIDFPSKARDALHFVDDRFGYNQSRSALLKGLDKAMESSNVQLQLSIHCQLTSNCFREGQWNDAAFHAKKTLEIDDVTGVLGAERRLHIDFTRAAIAKELGDLKGAEEIALEILSQITDQNWPGKFEVLVLLAQVRLQEGSNRWATIESSVSALKVLYTHTEEFRHIQHEPGKLFAFIFQSLWSETSNGTQIVDEDIERLSKMLGSPVQEVEAGLSMVNDALGAFSDRKGGMQVNFVFARAERSFFWRFGLRTSKNDEGDNEGDQTV